MPYQKVITVYSPWERKALHGQGIWIDKSGNQIPVRNMDKARLQKLVSLLYKWAWKEDYPYEYLNKHPIFVHVLLRIRELELYSFEASIFEQAYQSGVNHDLLY